MVTAQIVGGPHDGAWLEINEREMFVEVPLYDPPIEAWEIEEWGEIPVFHTVRMVPMLTRDGYRLYWPKVP